jgi:hypothetical protein
MSRRDTLLRLWRWREVRVWLAIVVGAGAVAGAWIVGAGALRVHSIGQPVPLPATEALRATLGKSHMTIREMIGNFGWLDTPAPTFTTYVWFLGLGFVVVTALLVAFRRDLAVLALLLAATVLVPVLVEARSVSEKGLIWQGRYTLPLAVGVPILAAFAIARAGEDGRGVSVRTFAPLAVLVAAAHVAAFAWAERRFTVGLLGPINYLGKGNWSPVLPAGFLLATFTAAAGAYAWWLTRTAAPDG